MQSFSSIFRELVCKLPANERLFRSIVASLIINGNNQILFDTNLFLKHLQDLCLDEDNELMQFLILRQKEYVEHINEMMLFKLKKVTH